MPILARKPLQLFGAEFSQTAFTTFIGVQILIGVQDLSQPLPVFPIGVAGALHGLDQLIFRALLGHP